MRQEKSGNKLPYTFVILLPVKTQIQTLGTCRKPDKNTSNRRLRNSQSHPVFCCQYGAKLNLILPTMSQFRPHVAIYLQHRFVLVNCFQRCFIGNVYGSN